MGNACLDGRLEPRIARTHPLLARPLLTFLVAGAEKREISGLLLETDRDLPSPGLAAVGKMRLFADTAATGRSAPQLNNEVIMSLTSQNAAQARSSTSEKVDLDELCINTIRTLSMDAVQKANSGHPGAPMGLAPVAYTLWQQIGRAHV